MTGREMANKMQAADLTAEKLKQADTDLEDVARRHAELVHRIMESQLHLFPFFMKCGSCELRSMDINVVPCSHMPLCRQCLNRVEFYVVPRSCGT